MNFKLTEVDVTAYVFYDKSVDLYTIYDTSKGGVIVNNKSEEKAKEEFERALKLTWALRNFLYFKKALHAESNDIKLSFIKSFKEKAGKVEYITEVA